MNKTLALKLGQVGGVILMAAGLAAHMMRTADPTLGPELIGLGLLLYGGCRLAAWLGSKDP